MSGSDCLFDFISESTESIEWTSKLARTLRDDSRSESCKPDYVPSLHYPTHATSLPMLFLLSAFLLDASQARVRCLSRSSLLAAASEPMLVEPAVDSRTDRARPPRRHAPMLPTGGRPCTTLAESGAVRRDSKGTADVIE